MKVAVVGAGIFGIAAALELRAREHEVWIFEQGDVPNPDASSTDNSKMIRRDGYGPVEDYVELAERGAEQWERWHQQIGDLFFRVGKLHVTRHFGSDSLAYMSWERFKDDPLGSRILTLAEAKDRFPQFAFKDAEFILHDAWTGYVRSGAALVGLAGIAQAQGVQILADTTVLEIIEDATSVIIRHGRGTTGFDLVVVCCGAWVGKLVPELADHLSVTRQEMAFFKPKDAAPYRREIMPGWTFEPYEDGWYGFPLLDEGYVKVAMHNRVHQVDANVERVATSEFFEAAKAFVARRIPGLAAGDLIGGRACLYTNTHDNHFIIDWAPGFRRTVVAGGGSGHGFKFGGSIGPIIADVTEERDNRLGEIFRIGTRLS